MWPSDYALAAAFGYEPSPLGTLCSAALVITGVVLLCIATRKR